MTNRTFTEFLVVLCIGVTCPVFSQTIFRVPSEYPTIQAAIDEAGGEQDIILLAPGLYSGEGNRDVQVDGMTITIKGDGEPEDVVIDAGGSEGNKHNIFNITGYSNKEFRMRNLTLQGSWGKSSITSSYTYVIIKSCIFRDNQMATYGGAVNSFYGMLYCFNTRFQNNRVLVGGGAITAYYSSLSGCVFEDNYAGNHGGGLNSLWFTEIKECVFRNNEARWDGGGVSIGGDAYISDSTFKSNSSYNYGGGGFFIMGSYVKLDRCVFMNNVSAAGGGCEIYNWNECDITNCVFANNYASYEGGGIEIGGVFWGRFINNTVCGNSAGSAGGGLRLNQTYDLEITNCITWNNSAPRAPELFLTDKENPGYEANVEIAYSVIEESETLVEGENHHLTFGDGIIPINPDFLDPESQNYQLSCSSVCIDNGRSEGAPDKDCFGSPRPIGSNVDMGAYEFQTALLPGMHLFMEDITLTAGDTFALNALNVTETWSESVAMVLVLEINGTFYFYPTWQTAFSFAESTLDYGRQWKEIVSLQWPGNVGFGSGLTFWGALLNPEDFSLIGDIDAITWSYF